MQALEQRLSVAAAALAAPLEEGIGSEEAGDDSMIDIREEWDEALHGAPSSGELLQLTFTRRMPLPVHP